MSSPLRRAVQTASLAFSPVIARPEVQYLVVPEGQEVNDLPCDVGHPREELEKQLPELLGDLVDFELGKIDLTRVEDGWNSKVSISVYFHLCRFVFSWVDTRWIREANGERNARPSRKEPQICVLGSTNDPRSLLFLSATALSSTT